MSYILVVDDERSMVDFLLILLKQAGHKADGVTSFEDAERLIAAQNYDLLITDLRIRGRSGLELLKLVRELSATTETIMITAYATMENAVEAMKLGAYDYVTKPFNVDEFRILVEKALEKKSLREENLSLQEKLDAKEAYGDIVGKSNAMQKIFDLIDRIKDAPTNVLITGESGTGKEVIARALHTNSARASKSFVAVNCGALPENLIESELFGYKRGAFTGANSDHQGLVESAHGGTLFLDEIGELPQHLQVKLLRVLQERTIRRVGDTVDRAVDVRVVTATNRDLQEDVAKGLFREDLYFRLNVLHLHIPPLRERREDIPALAHHFLRRYNKVMRRELPGFTEACMARLETYPFPGNARELENIVERAVALTPGGMIGLESLPTTVATQVTENGPLPTLDAQGIQLENVMDELEKSYLLRALELSGGSKTKAAELLGMSFRSFRYKLDKFSLK
jgi:two-component system, NtrC family, response regulator PilR